MIIPDEWTFKDEQIAKSFDNHVREQLPWYNIATSMTVHFIRNYLPQDGVLVDLGCAIGNMTYSAREVLELRKAQVINIDNSVEMKKQFIGVGELTVEDIENFKIPRFDVCVLFLSLMFVKPSYRETLIIELMKNVNKGGCVLIMDKVESSIGYAGTVINRMSLHNKLAAGCDAAEILKKELSLSGVQRPIKQELLNSFQKWFQIGDFCGYLFEG
ncbi:methyltransferase type 12 [Vibrio sp. Y2-5]|uniref:methyltransferase domain-containing protein n=1 Tax=Vibrio TaxID=662 RepID=UPI00142D42F6|nr:MULTISPECIES: methyltransferase domain-containing protein [Vibrio]MBD0785789.1 methyltransferase type 12 [Vibrio sp. Y2-5]NIY91113.1 methyltransferase type 12 [Vibrio diazotrophicus]